MIAEYLHARLRVRIIGRLEAHLRHTVFLEELFYVAHEMAEIQMIVCDQSLDLVELCEMSGVQRLVTKHTID